MNRKELEMMVMCNKDYKPTLREAIESYRISDDFLDYDVVVLTSKGRQVLPIGGKIYMREEKYRKVIDVNGYVID